MDASLTQVDGNTGRVHKRICAYSEGVEKVSKVLGPLHPTPLFEPQNGSKSPRERDFHPLPVLGGEMGG